MMSSDSDSSSSSSGGGSETGSLGRRATGHVRFSTTLALDGGVDKEEILRNEERDLVESGRDEFRLFLFEFTEHRVFNVSILFIIFLNTVFIGLQTSEEIMAKSGWYLTMVDNVFLAIYIVEFLLKFYAWRLRYFKIGWNIFDFVIIVASFVDFLVPLIVQNVGTFDTKVLGVLTVFRAFRALRALRVLRTIRFLKNLQIIVTTVLRSIPALGNIVMLISLVLYVFAIIGRGLYAEVDPGRFGNLGVACYTLFQLMTLDDWFYMYSEVAERHPGHRHIFIYLLLFIVLETFIFMNLFVAVIVDNLEQTQAAARASKPKPKFKHTHNHDQESEMDITEGDTKHMSGAGSKTTRAFAIEEFYSTDEYTERERALRAQYLSLLSSFEYHLHVGCQHHTTMEEVVDLLDIAKN